MAFFYSASLSSGTSKTTSLESVAKRDFMIDSTPSPSLVEMSFDVTMATKEAWLSLNAALASESTVSSTTQLKRDFIGSRLSSFSSCCSSALSDTREPKTGFSVMNRAFVCRDSIHLGTSILLNASLLRSLMKSQQFAVGLRLIARGSSEEKQNNIVFVNQLIKMPACLTVSFSRIEMGEQLPQATKLWNPACATKEEWWWLRASVLKPLAQATQVV